ncbi:MAG: SH3 domain-containing protein [Pseudomonadota bacterium]
MAHTGFLAVLLVAALGTAFAAAGQQAPVEAATEAASEAAVAVQAAKKPQKNCVPGIGCVTNLPLPRFVSLKTGDGNARRGPGLTHRIDWVFTRAGMPLRITGEFDNWRRIEDAEGAGGWVHYSLLSGVRTVLVARDMAEFRSAPEDGADVVIQAERGVVGKVLKCTPDWCRVGLGGEKGWVRKSALWGVEPGEVIE